MAEYVSTGGLLQFSGSPIGRLARAAANRHRRAGSQKMAGDGASDSACAVTCVPEPGGEANDAAVARGVAAVTLSY